MTRKRKPLSTDDMKVVFMGAFGDSAPKSKIQRAIEQADEADAIRRRDKPTRDELISALESALQQSSMLSSSDIKHLLRDQKGIAKPAGAPKASENALLARDMLLYVEYGKQLGAGLEKTAAKRVVARKFGEGVATVTAAITRVRNRFRPGK